MKKILLLLIIILSTPLFSQKNKLPIKKGNKGQMYVLWGWNRSFFLAIRIFTLKEMTLILN